MQYSEGLKVSIEENLKRLKKLRELNIEPYPYEFLGRIEVKEILENVEKYFGKSVKIAGRILSVRRHGKLIFFDVYEEGNKIQVAASYDKLKENFELAKLLKRGDIIGAEGELGKTIKGELTVFADKIYLLTPTLIDWPDKWFGIEDIEERYRKRYLDVWYNENSRKTFEIKVKAIDFFRKYLKNLGYKDFSLEIPLIQPIYGGAYAKPFIVYVNDLKENQFLSISPEIQLKILLVAGFNKVFAITKNFRNESIDVTHNPEFIGFEFYEAYANRDKMMEIVENMIYQAALEILGTSKIKFKDYEIDLKPPWQRITVYDALKKYANLDVEKMSDEEIKSELVKHGITLKTKEFNRGLAIVELTEKLVEDKLIQPTFLIEHPIESTPLCKPSRKDPKLVERAEAYIAGIEIANIYSELNNPIIQNELLLQQAKMRELGFEEAHEYDKTFVEALMYGMPPAGGVGIGVERVVQIFTNNYSIKEVMFWPMMKRKNVSEAVDILTNLTSK